jgi:hypothetical protein
MATPTSSVKNKMEEAGTAAAQKGKELASQAADKAKELAHAAGEKADDAAAAVGSSMQSAAGTIRDKGPHGGMLGAATSRVAGTLESGGQYLKEEGVTGMMEDLGSLIRRNPIPALLVGLGIGYLLGHATRSNRS